MVCSGDTTSFPWSPLHTDSRPGDRMSGWKVSGESAGGDTRSGFVLTSFCTWDQSSPCSVYSVAWEDIFHAGRESVGAVTEVVGDCRRDGRETIKGEG